VNSNNESKISFLLNIVEPLIVNDHNNEIGEQSGLIEILVALLKSQDTVKQ
jgi:hypothetical protein